MNTRRTPYEAYLSESLAEAERSNNMTRRTVLGLVLDAYRQAKAEDAPLLAAAEAALDTLETQFRGLEQGNGEEVEPIPQLRAAVKQAKEGAA